jgi:hypothetical protein
MLSEKYSEEKRERETRGAHGKACEGYRLQAEGQERQKK